jgi:hypothetical protein
MMFNNEQRESLAMTTMQMQYEALRQKIADDTRPGAWVHNAPVTPTQPLAPDTGQTRIWIINKDNTIRRYYFISGNALLDSGVAFVSGHGPIEIESGTFSLTAFRDRVIFNNLRLRTTVNGRTYRLEPRSEAFLCRNWEY